VIAVVLIALVPRPAVADESTASQEPRAAAILSSADDPEEMVPLPVPDPTPLAIQYHRTGNVLWVFARLWELAVPLALLLTGASARLRDLARRIGRAWFFTVGVYVVLYLLVVFVLDLPLRYYAGFVRQHAYGLSVQTFGKWLGDSLKALAVDVVGGFLFAWVPFLLIARLPKRWWLATSLLAVPFLACATLIAPVWIDPLFNTFGPMKNKALEQEILALAHRAGIPGSRVFEVDKSIDTRTANAYVKGLLGTHRIVLWDTLLKDFDEREVLVVMGHEMGHYVRNHVAWSIAASWLVILGGLYWTDRAGRRLVARYSGRFGFGSLADVAATPLLLVLIGLASTVLTPFALAYSRHHEHEADRFALELTHLNRSAARTFAHFQSENLGIPRHSLLYTLWRSTHPSTAERIEFCNAYHPWRAGRPSTSPSSTPSPSRHQKAGPDVDEEP
jgi:Zn-dependent protease with chaperone function